MAKYETNLHAKFDHFLNHLHQNILKNSVSATLEDQSDYELDNVQIAVRVYERYSMLGNNRVSMNVTLIGKEDHLYVSIITSGGSQAVFFKVNTIGEHDFLKTAIQAINSYQ